MKRKKRLLVSLISLAFSISLMMFGVWASVNPTLSITGYVTFNISSSQVSVTGTIIDGYDANGNAIAFLEEKNFHYQDYTDREKTTLADWSINGGQPLYFKEDESGVTDIKLKFNFTNNSPFYTVAKFENVAATNNVNVTFDQQVVMDVKGGAQSSKSSTITYSVIDSSKTASSDINFTITFERYLTDGQTFAMFQQNFANQKPLTTEEVSRLQAEYDKNNKLEKQDVVLTPETQNNTNQRTQIENNNTNNQRNILPDNANNRTDANANSASTLANNQNNTSKFENNNATNSTNNAVTRTDDTANNISRTENATSNNTNRTQTNVNRTENNTNNTVSRTQNNTNNNVNRIENNTTNNMNRTENNTNNNMNRVDNNSDNNSDNNNVIYNNINNILRNRRQNQNSTQNQNGTNS